MESGNSNMNNISTEKPVRLPNFVDTYFYIQGVRKVPELLGIPILNLQGDFFKRDQHRYLGNARKYANEFLGT